MKLADYKYKEIIEKMAKESAYQRTIIYIKEECHHLFDKEHVVPSDVDYAIAEGVYTMLVNHLKISTVH